MKKYAGYILQEPVHYTERDTRREETFVPKTIFVFDPVNDLNDWPLSHLITHPPTDIVINKTEILKWGLSHGYTVEIDEEGFITRVGGVIINNSRNPKDNIMIGGWEEKDAHKVRELPLLGGRQGLQAYFPVYQVPLTLYRGKFQYSLRLMELLGPQGWGQSTFIGAQANSGKTTIIRGLLEAYLFLTTQIPNLKIILCAVGERDEDFGDYITSVRRTPHSDNSVEIFLSTKDELPFAHVEMLRLAINRAQFWTRAGYHVVAFYDSISQVVLSHSFSEEFAPTTGGMVTGGVYTASLVEIKRLMGRTGWYDYTRSLTQYQSALSPAKKGKANMESAYADVMMHSTTSSVWEFLNLPLKTWPKADLSSYVRNPERFCSPSIMRENVHFMDVLHGALTSKDNPMLKLKMLQDWAKANREAQYQVPDESERDEEWDYSSPFFWKSPAYLAALQAGGVLVG